jgi:hypothetical protein
MEKRQKGASAWQLVHVDDLPIPSQEELWAARRYWVNRRVLFSVGSGQWSDGMVYAITEEGEVKIAVWCGGAWVHGRVVRLEYASRVLRLANSGK